MHRPGSIMIRALPLGYVVTIDGEETAGFSTAAELAHYIETTLAETEPACGETNVERMPVVLRPQPDDTRSLKRRLFSL